MQFPITFEIPHIPKKVYHRYRRYAGWLHKPRETAYHAIALLVWAGMFVYSIVTHDGAIVYFSYGFTALVYIAIFTAAPLQQRTLWDGPSRRWQYSVTETSIEASTGGGVRQTWEYRALAYVREAKDAFYFVTDEKDGRAIIVPKEMLTPAQCAALAEVLGRCVPENKFSKKKAQKDG